MKNPALSTVREGWEGNLVIDGRFCNEPAAAGAASLWSALKWKLGGNPRRREKRDDAQVPETLPFRSGGREDRIVWLGHSSFFISVNGAGLVTDPCFGNSLFLRRKAGLPCSAGSLTGVDCILVSHDHRDHLERGTIERIVAANPAAEVLAPLGAERILSSLPVREMGWYQEYRLSRNIRIVFLPARHWGRRGLNDRNRVLWGSFAILTDRIRIFFAGDTSYRQAMFREIRSLLGAMDVCLLPIGAYAPEWMMSASHMNPEEAFGAFRDLGGRVFIPMHYGTYDLSDEPMGEPLRRLRRVAAAAGCAAAVRELPIGGEYRLPRSGTESE